MERVLMTPEKREKKVFIYAKGALPHGCKKEGGGFGGIRKSVSAIINLYGGGGRWFPGKKHAKLARKQRNYGPGTHG